MELMKTGTRTNSVQLHHEPGLPAAADPELEPLPTLPPVLSVHEKQLPKIFAPWILDVAERMECPSDYVAIPAMVSFCLLYTSPSPRDRQKSRMPSSA